jgi:hypothetical protein
MTTSSAAPGSDGTADGGAARRGGPPVWFALLGIGGLVLGALVIVLQVLSPGSTGSGATPTIPPTGAAAQRTADLVTSTLAAASFQVQVPQTSYRPGESPSLVDVPRQLLQVVLPSDPTGGYIVIYELPSSADATSVGRDFAAYLASGTGAIQYPRDARFVLRQVDRTLVFFPWSPSVSPDPEVARLADTLSTVGTAVGS